MFEESASAAGNLPGLLAAFARIGTDDGSTPSAEADGLSRLDAARLDELTALEQVKAACAAAQARLTAAVVASQAEVAAQWRARARECSDSGDFDGWRAAREHEREATYDGGQVDDGPKRSRRSKRSAVSSVGVASQVGLARRLSPHRGSRCVGSALALVHDLPWVLSVMESGLLSEHRADIVVTETSHLTGAQRALVDAELRESLGEQIGMLGDRDLARRVRAIAYRLDARAAMERARYAETQRRVSTRPAPDCMTWVTALLPVADGVAVHAALARDAATARASGDERTAGQLMADRLVELATGRAVTDQIPVELQVVITDRALLGSGSDGDELHSDLPGAVRGYGPVPAQWVHDLVAAPASPVAETARVWVRRLLTDPVDGTVVGMDTGRRLFDGSVRRFLLARDETCRTLWCDAPARHADHVVPHARGGPTSIANGQGLCVRCNLAKEQPGWRQHVVNQPGDTHTVETVTPTGHRYRSQPQPVLPGGECGPPLHLDADPDADPPSRLERVYAALLAA